MQKQLLLFIIIATSLSLCLPVVAQESRCQTTERMQELWSDPVFKAQHQKQLNKFKSFQGNQKSVFRNPDCSNGPVVIPIAFHYQGVDATPANIACLETLVLDQVSILNADYSASNADIVNWDAVSSNFPDTQLGNACVEFCLPTYSHPPESGIAEGDLAITYNQTFPDINNIPEWSGYLNIVIDPAFSGLGVSFVAGDFLGQTAIINACAFGSDNVASCLDAAGMTLIGPGGGCFTDPFYNKGRTVTHEVGHYLGLLHVFCDPINNGDGTESPNCTCDDSVFQAPYIITDTPTSSEAHGGCPDIGATTTSCGTQDLFMNFLDYVDDRCMYMFTSDQATVLHDWPLFNGFSEETPTQCQQCEKKCLDVTIYR